MKVFRMNDTETVVAKDLNEAHDTLMDILGYSSGYRIEEYGGEL